MVLATIDLATRIERAESRLVAQAIEPARIRDPRAFARELCGGIAAFAFPGAPYNKIAGLGFAGAFDETALMAIEAEYRDRGVAVVAEVSSLGDPSVARTLTRRGYALVGFEDVLARVLPGAALPTPAGDSAIREVDGSALPAWCDLMLDAFAIADGEGVASHETFDRTPLERAIRDVAACPHYVRLQAFRGGAPAAGAAMRIDDGIAQLCGAATLPTHRRRGIQSALLVDRLRRATALGCDLAVVTTAPGSKSQHNVRRLGFEMLYTRAILVLG